MDDMTLLATLIVGNNAPGAIECGQRFVKTMLEAGDLHEIGAEGLVLGSMQMPDPHPIAYIVRFDNDAHMCLIMGSKIGPATKRN